MTSIAAQGILIAAVFIVFYLVLVRPQQRRLKLHRELLATLRPGLRIATIGGLVGTIVRAEGPNLVTLEVGEGVTVTVLRTSVDRLMEPAGAYSAASHTSGKQLEVA